MSKDINIKKHRKFMDNYEEKKRKHLEKLATKMLKKADINDKLKTKIVDVDKIKGI